MLSLIIKPNEGGTERDGGGGGGGRVWVGGWGGEGG